MLLPFLALLAAAPASAGPPAAYLPVEHPAYEDLESLVAGRLVDSLAIDTRPLARTDIAAALLRAERGNPALAGDPRYGRLARELAREFQDLGADPPTPESPPLVDVGPRERRFRLSLLGHVRGDFVDDRPVAHFQLRDESSLLARADLQVWPGLAVYENLGITRVRSQRAFIDPIVYRTDLEITSSRAGITGRAGPFTGAAGYDTFRWGPGRRGTLLLSDAAGPMGFVALSGSFAGRITATSLSGIVSQEDGQYLAAHRLEFAVTPRLTVGASEAVRYHGRGLDLLYATGLLPYAVVERIHIRDGFSDSVRVSARANIMASIDAEARLGRGVSAYGELLIDDFATKNRDMPDRFGYQAGARLDRSIGDRVLRVLAEYTRVRRFTYATYYGQNFALRDRPLGFALGPDAENTLVEGALDLNRDWQIRSSLDLTNRGEGVLGEAWNPDEGFVSNSGLSGVVERTREVWSDLRFIPVDRLDLSAGVGRRWITNERHVLGADRSSWMARLAVDARY